MYRDELSLVLSVLCRRTGESTELTAPGCKVLVEIILLAVLMFSALKFHYCLFVVVLFCFRFTRTVQYVGKRERLKCTVTTGARGKGKQKTCR